MAAVGEWFCYLFLTFAGQYVFKYMMIITEWENNRGTGNIFPIQTIPFSVSHPNLLRDIWLNHTNMNWLWFPNPSLSLSMRTVVQYNIRILVLCDKEVASSSPKNNHFMQLYGRVGISKYPFLGPTWLFTMWLGDEKVRGKMSRMKIWGEWTFPLFGKERESGENGKQDENFPYWPTIFARCTSGENGENLLEISRFSSFTNFSLILYINVRGLILLLLESLPPFYIVKIIFFSFSTHLNKEENYTHFFFPFSFDSISSFSFPFHFFLLK